VVISQPLWGFDGIAISLYC